MRTNQQGGPRVERPARAVKKTIEEMSQKIEERREGWSQVDSPLAMRQMELEIASLVRQFGDGLTGAFLKHRLADPAFQAQTSAAARNAGGYR